MLGNLVNLARPSTRKIQENWILDSGASRHVTGASSELASYVPFPPTCKETIQTADRTVQPIHGIGTVNCTPSITLSSVLYVPSFPVNLVSLSSLMDHMDCHVTLDRENCLIEDRKIGKEYLGVVYGVMAYGSWIEKHINLSVLL